MPDSFDVQTLVTKKQKPVALPLIIVCKHRNASDTKAKNIDWLINKISSVSIKNKKVNLSIK